MARKYEALYGKPWAEVVPDYDNGWWMGTLCSPGGPELHVSGLESSGEVVNALDAVLDCLLRLRGKSVPERASP